MTCNQEAHEWADFFAEIAEIDDPFELNAFIGLLLDRFRFNGNPSSWPGIEYEPADVQARLGTAWLVWSSKPDCPSSDISNAIALEIQ